MARTSLHLRALPPVPEQLIEPAGREHASTGCQCIAHALDRMEPDGPDLDWNDGQVAPTMIYRHVLRFTAR